MKLSTIRMNDTFTAKVIKGRQIGSSIGFPTANLSILQNSLHLNRGVYGVKVYYNGIEYLGMINVGIRPTFHPDQAALHYEVHILDFDQDIYGETITVSVCFYLRAEISFPNIIQLVKQINKDKEITLKKFLSLNKEVSYTEVR